MAIERKSHAVIRSCNLILWFNAFFSREMIVLVALLLLQVSRRRYHFKSLETNFQNCLGSPQMKKRKESGCNLQWILNEVYLGMYELRHMNILIYSSHHKNTCAFRFFLWKKVYLFTSPFTHNQTKVVWCDVFVGLYVFDRWAKLIFYSFSQTGRCSGVVGVLIQVTL